MSTGTPPLVRARLEELLAGTDWIRRIVLVDRVGSTNDVARELAGTGAPAGTVVLAEEQTAGRGRQGRVWHSPRGLGLYVSVLLRPDARAIELTRFTLGAALAACEACRSLVPAEVEIRWPNDLLAHGAKLGGVLAEARSGPGPSHELVVGTGLNVGHASGDLPADLVGAATSLWLLGGGTPPERERVAARYLEALGGVLRALECGGWDAVRRRWEAFAPGARGQHVHVLEPGGAGGWVGRTAGIDEVGALQVRRPDGRTASVRGIDSVRPAAAGEV